MDRQEQRRVLEALGRFADGAQNADVKTPIGKPCGRWPLTDHRLADGI